MISSIFARGKKVDKIKQGRYYGTVSTAIGTLEWIEMNVVSSADDDVKAWFLFGNSNKRVRMPREPLEAKRREHTTIALKRKLGHSYIQISMGESETIPSNNCWGFGKKKEYVTKLRPVYEKFSIAQNLILTALFRLCRTSDNWVIFFGNEGLRENVERVSSPVIMKRQHRHVEEPSSTTTDGVLDPITPVRSTLQAPGHVTGATNHDTLRETPAMSTEDTPSPSTTEAVTQNPPGAGVNKMEPGLYYGAAATTIGTLEWIEMNVLLSADDDVKAWFLFGNSNEKVRMPREPHEAKRREHATIALKRKRGHYHIQVIVGESETIPSSNCWGFRKKKEYITELRPVYDKYSIAQNLAVTSLFHLCRTSDNWVIFFGSEGIRENVVKVSSPVIIKRQHMHVEEPSARITEGVLDPRTPVRSTMKAPGHVTGATNDDTLRETPVMSTEATPSPSTTADVTAVTENPSGEVVNKMEPGLYYGVTSTFGTVGWIEMTVLASTSEDINAWFIFGNSTMSDRMPREEDTTVVLKRKSLGGKIQATIKYELYTITRRNCWALSTQLTSVTMLSRVYSTFSMKPDSQLTPSLHICWTNEHWVLFLESPNRCQQRVTAGCSPVVMSVKGDQRQTSPVVAAGSMVEENEPSLEASAVIRAVDEENEGRVAGADNNYNPPRDASMVTMHEAAPLNTPSTTATGTLPVPTIDWFAPSSTGQQSHETNSHQSSPTATTAPMMTPAIGWYFNEQTTEQLTEVSLKISVGARQSLEASLILFCTTARCSQSTLGNDKPRYFDRTSLGTAYGLAFTPPILSLTRIDELCFVYDTAGRRDGREIVEAFKLAGDIFEIRNFFAATTVMCWSPGSAAWNLLLGLTIDSQGEVSSDCAIQLLYTDKAFPDESSDGIEQLAETPQGTADGRVLGRRSASATTRDEGATPAKRARTGL
ncbi:hypothetical protein FOZ60_001545 [Perkinsus olseni]|uniref:Uncharacterized protein n=1 Tax=Perkinsus olseni TaxID=32597 RepID=A0A7J6P1G0_PEROL|nr:hypothetical protein FOZ60_001545 [Perkinsus olseni]